MARCEQTTKPTVAEVTTVTTVELLVKAADYVRAPRTRRVFVETPVGVKESTHGEVLGALLDKEEIRAEVVSGRRQEFRLCEGCGKVLTGRGCAGNIPTQCDDCHGCICKRCGGRSAQRKPMKYGMCGPCKLAAVREKDEAKRQCTCGAPKAKMAKACATCSYAAKRKPVPTCVDCGAAKTSRKSARCKKCGLVYREQHMTEEARKKRREVAKRVLSELSPEERSRRRRVTIGHMTPDERREHVRAAIEARKSRLYSMTPDERRALMDRARLGITPEIMSKARRKAQASMTPDQRSEAVRKAWETRRAKASAQASHDANAVTPPSDKDA